MSDTQERVYEYIKRRTVDHHTQRAIKEAELKTSLCANGSLDVAQVDTALRALGEQDKIQYGEGWIIPVVDKQFHRECAEWLANRDNPPKALIGNVNKAVRNHEW
jgi:hypothetical protein